MRFRPDALNSEFRDELAVAIVRSWGVLKISAEAAGNQKKIPSRRVKGIVFRTDEIVCYCGRQIWRS